jgi:hypothetical protein
MRKGKIVTAMALAVVMALSLGSQATATVMPVVHVARIGNYTQVSNHWSINYGTGQWYEVAGGIGHEQSIRVIGCPPGQPCRADPDGAWCYDQFGDQGAEWIDGQCVMPEPEEPIEECQWPDCTPILVPMDNSQQFKLTSRTNGVFFDLNGDGIAKRTAWTAAEAKVGFLALDRNGNGRIDDGTELVGNFTVPSIPTGFEALIALSHSQRGYLDVDDALFQQLLLWVDRNHNAQSEPAELSLLKEPYSKIGLGAQSHQRKDGYGNLFRWKGWVEVRTGPGQNKARSALEHQGRLRDIFDVIFASTK